MHNESLLRQAIREMIAPAMLTAQKKAACVLIRRGDRVLAVSRRDDPSAMGMPGGKVDPEDGPADQLLTSAIAAARELYEETGLIVSPYALTMVFEHSDDDCYSTTTFEAAWKDVSGVIRTAETGRVRWVSWDELINGPFGEYNIELMATLGEGQDFDTDNSL